MSAIFVYNIGSAFESIVARHGERCALAYPDERRVTYSELDALANRVARVLLEHGLRLHSVVAIFNEKSVRALATQLACLKLGVVYTNLDITSPWPRVEKMLNTCTPSLAVFDRPQPRIAENIRRKGIPTLDLSDESTANHIASRDAGPVDTRAVTGTDPAYIMFTSGSTGFPKGAVMSHANVLGFVRWGQAEFEVTPSDVFTNVNPMYFDNSVFDFYTALLSGATLCLLTAEVGPGIGKLVESVNRLGCTIWFSVPSLLVYLLITKSLRADDFSRVTRIVFGGEGFPKPKLQELYGLFGHRARLVNVYGPTECTCICSAYDIGPVDFDDLTELAPLGLLAPNFDYRIVPTDAADPEFGELYLGGPNVGLGYHGDAERTARSFVQDPEETRFRRIMYRTGDLVRRREDGFLLFRGRADNQIKYMGYRIELEEIEAALNSLDYVNEAAVVYQQLDAGLGRIVAFANASRQVAPEELTRDVQHLVPPYMVPKRFHLVGSLPKNRNGKIDRVQLQKQA